MKNTQKHQDKNINININIEKKTYLIGLFIGGKMNSYLKNRNIFEITKMVKKKYVSNKLNFHNFSHINDGLEIIKELPDSIKVNDTQLIAWLFHDIVYKIGSDTNEEDSATYFLNFYVNYKYLFSVLNINTVDVVDIILDTKDHKQERSKNSDVILDVDLSCLAGSYDRFKKGRINVLKEYKTLYKKEALKEGTLQFLESIGKSNIFITEHFKKMYEKEAKTNILKYKEEIDDYINSL